MFLYTKKVATVAIVVLMTIALCSTTIEEVRTQFLRNKVIASSYATKQPISQLHCIEWCSRERQVGKCRIAGYHKSSKTCKLSMDYPYTLLNVADEASGVFLIETEPTCGTEEPLVGGLNPVPDSHFTASSVLSSPSTNPYKARLNSASAWSASVTERDAPEPNYYLQVQFWGTSTVTAVETMGYPGGIGRVTMYRLKVSMDCVSFYPLLDGNGNNATFQGNSDTSTIKSNPLATPVTALCLQLYPLTFFEVPNVRLEVKGCQLT